MDFFKKLFHIKTSEEESSVESPQEAEEPITIDQNTPIDERFMLNFKNNGGKFIYCASIEDVFNAFENILLENGWEQQDVFSYEKRLMEKFENFDINFNQNISAAFFLSTCEFLIADTGALLLSSRQMKGRKLNELPANLVIYASTSQIVKNIDEGMSGITARNKQHIPSNITTIKNFDTSKDQDFMSYGSAHKDVYLLLLEDL
ncbi:hypothetical protein GCM10009117_23070 [Gangjinia marincola]|uniref:LUD domain-containing protein n=1 Tax=Gangjinia marincola TaxID=578463 RepID=A0ABN1MJW8_9FLAO